MSFGLVALIALLVIALGLFASPLIAAAILGIAVLLLLLAISGRRRRPASHDQLPSEEPGGDQPIPEAAGPVPPASGGG